MIDPFKLISAKCDGTLVAAAVCFVANGVSAADTSQTRPLASEVGTVPVGVIVEIRGPWSGLTVNKKPAGVGQRLVNGDLVRASGATRVTLVIDGREDPVILSAASKPLEVQVDRSPGFKMTLAALGGLLKEATSPPPQQTTRSTHTRGDGEAASKAPFTRSVLLPTETLIVPTGTRRVSLTWCGTASSLQLMTGGSERTTDVSASTLVPIALPEGPSKSFISIQGKDAATRITYTIVRADISTIPKPAEFGDRRLTSEEKGQWGGWLLQNSIPAYHAFALTLIHEASEDIISLRDAIQPLETCSIN